MYVFYFCTDHATRKAQQTSKNARRASSKFNCGRMWHWVVFFKDDRKQPASARCLTVCH